MVLHEFLCIYQLSYGASELLLIAYMSPHIKKVPAPYLFAEGYIGHIPLWDIHIFSYRLLYRQNLNPSIHSKLDQ